MRRRLGRGEKRRLGAFAEADEKVQDEGLRSARHVRRTAASQAAEARRTSRARAEARVLLELGKVCASGGGESGRRASAQLSRSQALDDQQAAAAERTGPTGAERVFVRERDSARRVDASDQAAAERQQLAAFGVGEETPVTDAVEARGQQVQQRSGAGTRRVRASTVVAGCRERNRANGR